tara:strand:+ start:2395 stop:2541 length:147 start_codon:yes stop_codon:yes gene_type:complete
MTIMISVYEITTDILLGKFGRWMQFCLRINIQKGLSRFTNKDVRYAGF